MSDTVTATKENTESSALVHDARNALQELQGYFSADARDSVAVEGFAARVDAGLRALECELTRSKLCTDCETMLVRPTRCTTCAMRKLDEIKEQLGFRTVL